MHLCSQAETEPEEPEHSPGVATARANRSMMLKGLVSNLSLSRPRSLGAIAPCGPAILENTGQAGTRLVDGVDFLRQAVRDAALEYRRLLEASQLKLEEGALAST
jgi:hypothetical protein